MHGANDTETPVDGDDERKEVGGVEEACVDTHQDQTARLPVLPHRAVRHLQQAVHPAAEHRQQEAAVRHRQAGQVTIRQVRPGWPGNNTSGEARLAR